MYKVKKIYVIGTCNVTVFIQPKLIQILGSSELLTFLSADLKRNTLKLVKLIKADYLELIGKRLKITNRSFKLEIWGHLYASQLADAVKELVKLKVIENFTEAIKSRSDTIDCGESEVDSNRWLWDMLSRFNNIIIRFLPKKAINDYTSKGNPL
ncbi:MAG: hypothetical protein EOO90_01955 [Pedobacter sp.]|nr:MAG: hypothetical protein EOO90_01955 [Pedobacter sp.]